MSYDCGVDAEPLYRYRPGGFHPVAIGDVLNHGRYKILHKLGWGGYSTTWAAKDQQDNQYVAVKIATSESRNESELFELVTGQPPFDSIMIPADLVQQMVAFATDGLPPRWQEKWKAMEEKLPIEEETHSLQCYSLCQWLKEVYFDDHRQPEFTTDDIAEVGKLVSMMLKFEPSHRASAINILASDWFK
ncbi:unnamed protein product [Clonostachys solani]|uniref:non-specific serine/threonine protein kinase n=1 Tax=Clonostachys solani TaxID=160281 RepID=A0A9N9ZDV4_9HYPO|nr:unnamed protein product [Clonostachys solani]